MEELKFVLKCAGVTALLVMLLQIRMGGKTLEGHTMTWVHHSPVSHVLQDVAEGAVKVTKQGTSAVTGFVNSQRSSNDEPTQTQQASTGGWFKIKRSAAYYRQEAQRKERESKRAQSLKEEPNVDSSFVEGSDESDRN